MSQNFKTSDFVVDAIQDRKGKGITIIDLSKVENAGANCFVIAEGTSTTQTAAIAAGIEDSLREKAGLKPYGIVGSANGEWIVMDYGDTWVHIFLPPVRQRYNLEELWSDADITEIPDLD